MTQLAPPPGSRGAVPPSRRTAPPAPRRPQPSRGPRVPARGRHATTAGQGFGYVIKWTILGALLPGSALIAAGRRRAGWFVSGMGLLTVVTALGWLAANSSLDDLLKAGLTQIVDPSRLLVIAIGIAVVTFALAVALLAGHAALRERSVLTRGQRLISSGLVAALLVGIGVPAAKGVRYALITRDLVDTVFADNPDSPTKPGKTAQVGKSDPWAGVDRVNLLIMGSDAGKGREGLRPDSMILASISPAKGDAIMFNIPRNLQRVPFPDGSVGAQLWPHGFGPGSGRAACGSDGSFCEMNAVWRTAEESQQARSLYQDKYGKGTNVGLKATEEAVTGLLGNELEPDYYVMLNLNGFKDFVDAIGGITVNVRAENKKGLPIGGDGTPGSRSYHVATGGWIHNGDNQKLDGYHALWFARSRWGELSGDYSRMKRQRCAIAAIAQQADPLKLFQGFPKIAASLKTNLSTNIPQNQLSAWADLALRIKKGHVRSLPILKDTYGGDWANPNFDLVRQVVAKNLDAPAPTTPKPQASVSASGKPNKHRTSKPAKPANEADTAQDIKDVC